MGDVEVANGEAMIIPTDITWDADAVVKTTAQHAWEIVDACRNEWRTANGGQKPRHLAYFGGMTIGEVKDALGYNTELLTPKTDRLQESQLAPESPPQFHKLPFWPSLMHDGN